MSEHLLKAGANITPREGDELARLPYLRTWFRTRSAIILHLSNGTVQINFFEVSSPECTGGPWARQGLWRVMKWREGSKGPWERKAGIVEQMRGALGLPW